jgi:hypothetical protein
VSGIFAALWATSPPVLFIQVIRVVFSRPGVDAELIIEILGQELYKRSSPNPSDFDVDIICWCLAPWVVFIVVGAVGGAVTGYVLDRWLLPRKSLAEMLGAGMDWPQVPGDF